MKSWHRFQFVLIILASLHFPPDVSPGACSFAEGLGFPDSSVWLRLTWSRVPRRSRRGLFPVARPARFYESFQLMFGCQGWAGRGRRAGREDGKQAAGLWDHFALTYIPSRCFECLNMKTTQLLLTPALPPKHSNSN